MMRHLLHLLLLSLGLLWISPTSAIRPGAEELIAPLQSAGIPRSAERVRAVRDELTGEPALQARTAQAAIAAAVGQRAAGCRMIRFGNGLGWVATGTAAYPETESLMAARRFEQEARLKAFVDARLRLSEYFAGLSRDARQRVTENLEQQDNTIRLALINLATNDQERLEQALKILARGFVVYAVETDSAARVVYVHLVTTLRTATRLTRPTPGVMEAASLHEGLKQTLAEIESRLIPTAGHRQIVVNATGEMAFIGYAINLVGVHPDRVAQQKLRADAEKIALSRATGALIGLTTGDDAAWRNELDEISRAEILATAHGYTDGEPSVRRFMQIRDLIMLGTLKDDPGLQALREGRLPSAISIRRFDGDNHVSVALVYSPPVRKRETVPPAPLSLEPPTNSAADPGTRAEESLPADSTATDER